MSIVYVGVVMLKHVDVQTCWVMLVKLIHTPVRCLLSRTASEHSCLDTCMHTLVHPKPRLNGKSVHVGSSGEREITSTQYSRAVTLNSLVHC